MNSELGLWSAGRTTRKAFAASTIGALSMLAVTAAAAETVTVTNKLAAGYDNMPLNAPCNGDAKFANIPQGFWIERPHRRYNARTGQWVMWAHYESAGYRTAEAIVGTSATECGPYKIVKTFRPLGLQVRDDFLFKDDDGTAYFLAASNQRGGANDSLAIFRLTPDWLDVDEAAGVNWAFSGAFREAPIVLRKDNVYFLLTSQAAGWFPSQAMYATATSMMGEWSDLQRLGNSSSYGAQLARDVVVKGTKSTAYMVRLSHLGGNVARDDGSLLLPVLLDSTARTATMKWYSSFQVNTETGALTLPSSDSIAANRRAIASSTGAGRSPMMANDRNHGTGWFANGNKSWPAWWMTDLGSARHIGEVQISWPMTKGSEAYYKYKLEYSTDGSTWSVLDRTSNVMYGFTIDNMDVTARYLRVRLETAVLQNNPTNWYTPGLWDVTVLP